MNVAVLERDMEKILAPIDIDEIATPTLFIRGALSNYILDEDIESIEEHFIDVEIKTIENAGHWVHAEQADEFLNTLLAFCIR